MNCPICGIVNSPQTLRCTSCGADFHDPDVRALFHGEAPSIADNAELLDGSESLATTRFLRITADALDAGSGVTKVAIIAAILGALGFVIPVSNDFTTYRAPWSAEDGRLALLLPLGLVLICIIVAAMNRLDARLRCLPLAILGCAGLITLPLMGGYAIAGTKLLPHATIALLVAGAALSERLFTPDSRPARLVLAGGAIVYLVSMFVPLGSPAQLLPAEMHFYVGNDSFPDSSSPASMWWQFTERDHLRFFIGNFALVPMVVLPAAAAVALGKRQGVWDHSGFALKPLAWILVLFVPLHYALMVFNLMGWDKVSNVSYYGFYGPATDFTQAGMVGRAKLAVLSCAYAYAGNFGLVGCWRALQRSRRESSA